jgi:SagB-type dehydrogenase family enzyme
LTFGVQQWVDLGPAGRAMLRTSPSAGARNPLEAYVVARRVASLPPAIYHYGPDVHQLVRVRARHCGLDAYLAGQRWFANAAALVLMTAVFERTEWKYPFARAYRTILLEAGHFAQTFCLAATDLGLASFCSAALADSLVERDLGIDGVTESVIYACGVGMKPGPTRSARRPTARRRSR